MLQNFRKVLKQWGMTSKVLTNTGAMIQDRGMMHEAGGTDSAALRKIKLGGDMGDVEDPEGVSPPGGQLDCGDGNKTCGG